MATKQTGMHYIFEGLRLIRQPGLRRYVAVPLLVSVLFFSAAILGLTHWLEALIELLLGYLPGWLDWLRYLLWPVFALLGVLIIFYSFSIITNLIAAPFNGMLAEAVEKHLTGQPIETGGWQALAKDIVPSIVSELRKLLYFLLRALPARAAVPDTGNQPGRAVSVGAVQRVDAGHRIHRLPDGEPPAAFLYTAQTAAQSPFPLLRFRWRFPAADHDPAAEFSRHAGLGRGCDGHVGRGTESSFADREKHINPKRRPGPGCALPASSPGSHAAV